MAKENQPGPLNLTYKVSKRDTHPPLSTKMDKKICMFISLPDICHSVPNPRAITMNKTWVGQRTEGDVW